MEVRVGTDIVRVERFRAPGIKTPVEKIFLPSELSNRDPKHLAGIFAAKEAAMKALKIPAGEWQNIEITYEESGRPQLNLLRDFLSVPKILSWDLSISHDGGYAIAVAVFLISGNSD